MSSISISPAASRRMGAEPAGGRPDPAPTPAEDLTRSGPFPPISSHQRPATTGDFHPGSSKDRGKTPAPTAAGPAPGTYHQGATNKVTGQCPVDLVERHFSAFKPNELWVADIPPQTGGTPSTPIPTPAPHRTSFSMNTGAAVPFLTVGGRSTNPPLVPHHHRDSPVDPTGL